MSRTIVVRCDDGSGDLFLGDLNEFDAGKYVVLDAADSSAWEEYVAACQAVGRARDKVQRLLRVPYRSEIQKTKVTP